jgi:hypothetical protein
MVSLMLKAVRHQLEMHVTVMSRALILTEVLPKCSLPTGLDALQGTHVTSGHCRAVVVGTGAATAIGKIRDAMAASQVGSSQQLLHNGFVIRLGMS